MVVTLTLCITVSKYNVKKLETKKTTGKEKIVFTFCIVYYGKKCITNLWVLGKLTQHRFAEGSFTEK